MAAVQQTQNLKCTLYHDIVNNRMLTNMLKKWLGKIYQLCYNHKQLYMPADTNFNMYFQQEKNPQAMCGYIDITIQNLIDMIDIQDKGYNQRTLLTTIYRFARVYAKVIWDFVHYKSTLDEVWNAMGAADVIDKGELKRHMLFVLQKHGITLSGMNADPVDALKKTFIPDLNMFLSDTTYPCLMTSITQPIGFDPVGLWMTGYSEKARQNNNPYNDNKRTIINKLTGCSTALCQQELKYTTDPKTWITGAVMFSVNPNSNFAKLAEKYKKFTRCGPSCTTQMMLDCALLFGMDPYHVLFTLLPWMELTKDHSLFEICLAADAYLPFDKYVLVEESGPQKNDKEEYNFIVKLYNRIFGKQLLQAGGKRKKKVVSKRGGNSSVLSGFNAKDNPKIMNYLKREAEEERRKRAADEASTRLADVPFQHDYKFEYKSEEQDTTTSIDIETIKAMLVKLDEELPPPAKPVEPAKLAEQISPSPEDLAVLAACLEKCIGTANR